MEVFKAKLEFQTEDDMRDNVASSHTIMFSSVTRAGADLTRDVMRWFLNRRQNMPEHFTRLCALTICGQRFPEFREDGYLEGCSAAPFIEWKIDAHPLPEGVDLSSLGWKFDDLSRLAQILHRQPGKVAIIDDGTAKAALAASMLASGLLKKL